MGQIVLQLFQSLGQTFKVFVLTLVFSLPLGFVVAAGRMSRHKLISVPVNLFIMIMRGTPLILQLLFVYFAPFYLFGVSFPRFTACIVAFVLNYSSYFAEIYRGGLQSIDRGQHEACRQSETKSSPWSRTPHLPRPSVWRSCSEPHRTPVQGCSRSRPFS